MTHRLFMTALACAVAAVPGVASAHAFLQTATPGVGSTIAAAPAEVRLDFTEGVEPAFSSITVVDASGKRVDDGKPHLEGGDAHLAVGLNRLAHGRYTVSWQVVSIDTHHTQGTFHFTIAP